LISMVVDKGGLLSVMRKLFIWFLVLGSMMVVSSYALAEARNISKSNATPLGISKTISAYVNPWATIEFGNFTPAHLTGAANDIQEGSLGFTVKANCAVELVMSASTMTRYGNEEAPRPPHTPPSTLTTLYDITTGNAIPNYKPVTEILPWDHALDQESKDFTLHYQVADGEDVTSQHAGSYRAFVSIYVIALSY
jgi:hypothetical protein